MLEWLVNSVRSFLPHEAPQVVRVVERVPAKKGRGGLKLDSEFTIYIPNFRNDDWKWQIPVSTYLAYKGKPRRKDNDNEQSYWKFVTPEDAYIYEITEEIGRKCLGSNWRAEKKEFVDLVIDFIGHIPYHKRNPCYVKYPVEMLCEFGGNCVDASILGASMLTIGGIGTCFVHFKEHVVLGVDVSADGKYVRRCDNTKFYITDVTGSEWPLQHETARIGYLHEDYDLFTREKIEFKPAGLSL